MAYFYGLILLLFSLDVFALVPQASATGYYVSGVSAYGARFPSQQAACTDAASRLGADLTGTVGGSWCNVTRPNGDLKGSYAISHGTHVGCPSNSTPSGSSCACNSGYIEQANQCVLPKPVDACELLADMCSGSQGMSTNFSLPGRKTGVSFTCMAPTAIGTNDPLPGCTKGCMAQVGGFTTAFQDNSGSWVTTGSAKYSGATCDPSVINDLNAESDPEYEPEENPKTSDKPDPSCPGGFKGTVNGVSVCVPPKSSSGVTEMESKDNGDGTKTDSKTQVKCENGQCEVTKTSTTTNIQTGSTVSSSSVTTTVDKATYCSQNKTAGACKNEKGENEDGNGSFGGSCDAGFTCKGDAVMCAMAKEQHKRNCEMLGEDKDPASFFNQVKNGTDSKSAEALKGEAKQINIGTQLDMSGSGLSRSCPADPRIDLPFAGKSFVIPFSAVCPTLKTMSDVALMITALSLLVWLVNGRKEGE